nr:zinc finger, GRF-type [Tanacetum cinerariifolium]
QVVSGIKEIKTRVQQVESRVDTYPSGQMAVPGQDVIVGLSQQVQTLQMALHGAELQNQQLRTKVAEMESHEGRGRQVFYFCFNVKLSNRTSWTDINPGRRFLACPQIDGERCIYFDLVDPPMCQRAMMVIPRFLRTYSVTSFVPYNESVFNAMFEFCWYTLSIVSFTFHSEWSRTSMVASDLCIRAHETFPSEESVSP